MARGSLLREVTSALAEAVKHTLYPLFLRECGRASSLMGSAGREGGEGEYVSPEEVSGGSIR